MSPAPRVLQDLQGRLHRAIIDDAPPADLAGLLRPLGGRAPRLGVYRHAYRARLAEALRHNHPTLHRALGDEGFDALARAYLAAQPSPHRSIRWFGDGLADFIAAQGAPQAPHPALIDLARMDWALGRAFDAADAPPLDAATLAATPAEAWGALRLQAHPSVQRLALAWGVEPLWRHLQARPDAPAPEPPAQEHALLLWRHGLQTHWRTLAPAEDALLRGLLDGTSLAALCELAAAAEPDGAAARVAATLQRWVADGLVCRAMT